MKSMHLRIVINMGDDCSTICMVCESDQDFKVNFSKYHGVCNDHLKINSVIECRFCKSQVPLLAKIDYPKNCEICQETNSISLHKCRYYVCKSCYSFSNHCPICKPDKVKFSEDFIEPSLKKKMKIEDTLSSTNELSTKEKVSCDVRNLTESDFSKHWSTKNEAIPYKRRFKEKFLVKVPENELRILRNESKIARFFKWLENNCAICSGRNQNPL